MTANVERGVVIAADLFARGAGIMSIDASRGTLRTIAGQGQSRPTRREVSDG